MRWVAGGALLLVFLLPLSAGKSPEPQSQVALPLEPRFLSLSKDGSLALASGSNSTRGVDVFLLNSTNLLARVSTGTPEGPIALLLSRSGGAFAYVVPQQSISPAPGVELVSSPPRLTWGRIDPSRGAFLTNTTRDLPSGEVRALAFSEDGSVVAVLVSTPSKGEIRSFSLDGRSLLVFSADGPLSSLSLSSDGRYLAAGGRILQQNSVVGVVLLFDLQGANPSSPFFTAQFSDPEGLGEVVGVALSPDGKVLVSTTKGGKVVAWERSESSLSKKTEILLGNSTLSQLAFSEDGGVLLVGGGTKIFSFTSPSPAVLQLTSSLSLSHPTERIRMDRWGAFAIAEGSGRTSGISTDPLREIWNLSSGRSDLSFEGRTIAWASGSFVRWARFSPSLGLVLPPSVEPIRPFETRQVNLTVLNLGFRPERVRLFSDPPVGVDLSLSPSTLPSLLPENPQNVTVRITPSSLPSGTYSVLLGAEVERTSKRFEIPLRFDVASVSGISLHLQGPPQRTIGVGQTAEFLVGLQNVGNTPQHVVFTLDQRPSEGPFWSTTLLPAETTISGGSVQTVTVRLTPSPQSPKGTTNVFTLKARTESGIESVTVEYLLSPTLGVNLSIESRARLVPLGGVGSFNVSVKNTGTIPTTFEAFYDSPLSTQGKTWVVDLDPTPFDLEAGRSTIVEVRVFPPPDGSVGDSFSFRFTVRSVARFLGDPVVKENLTLVANLVPRPPTPSPTPPVVPSTPLPLVFSLFALLALSRRR